MKSPVEILSSFLNERIPGHTFSFRIEVYVDQEPLEVSWEIGALEELIVRHGEEAAAAFLAAVAENVIFCLRRREHPEEDWRVSSEFSRNALRQEPNTSL